MTAAVSPADAATDSAFGMPWLFGDAGRLPRLEWREMLLSKARRPEGIGTLIALEAATW
jgi:hypothetical protein